MNKKISFPIAVVIIVVCAAIVGGLAWQYRIIPGIGSTSTPTPPKDETADWKIYRNEEYGFEFKYPREWISLELKSQENNEVYFFESSNESIKKVFYFKPQNIIIFIVYGKNFSSICPEWDEIFQVHSYSEEILKILYSNKEIKTVYITKTPKECLDIDFIGDVSLSPNGQYAAFNLHGFEWLSSIILNIENGLDILKEGAFYNPYKDIYWSPSNKVLVIVDTVDEPYSTIWVSDYGNVEKLNKILPLCVGPCFSDVYFVDDSKLFFSKTFEKKETKYEYDIKTKELKEIK